MNCFTFNRRKIACIIHIDDFQLWDSNICTVSRLQGGRGFPLFWIGLNMYRLLWKYSTVSPTWHVYRRFHFSWRGIDITVNEVPKWPVWTKLLHVNDDEMIGGGKLRLYQEINMIWHTHVRQCEEHGVFVILAEIVITCVNAFLRIRIFFWKAKSFYIFQIIV